jgi:hypothetical protein
MGGLLKYAIVLALGVVIGAYIALEPPRLEDIAPIRTEREAAVEHAPPPTPASPASINEEVAKQLALETAKAEQLLFAGKTPAPEALSSTPSDARPAGEPTLPPSPWPQDAVPATATTTDASQDAKPMNEAARPAAPPAEIVGAAGTQPAAVAQDEICQRDRASLELLRSHPTSDELVRFGNKLGCKTLLPEVVSLLKGLAPLPTSGEASNGSLPDAQTGNEAAHPAPPVAGADVATLTSDEACKRDEDRLERLRSNPSGEEAQRFAGELGCESLRPQLQRLVESLRSVALAPTAPASSSPSSVSLLSQGCASERAALDRLRKVPSAEAAGAFWRDLRCEGLRPQVRLLMESLNVAPELVGSAAARSDAGGDEGAASDGPISNGADPVACRRETTELNRIRAAPNLSDAMRFASAVTCIALKPQAARLLESLRE